MKKNKFFVGLLLVMLMFGISTVNAKSTTRPQSGPNLTPGEWQSSKIYELQSAWEGVKESRTSVIFSNYAALADRYMADDNRKLVIDLYEYDVYPNEDDLVKTYTWTFSGHNLKEVSVKRVEKGNLDSADDDTVELYLRFKMDYIPGDSRSATNRFFDYNITVE